jgi:hypothetical protein
MLQRSAEVDGGGFGAGAKRDGSIMSKNKNITIEVQGTAIAIVSQKDEDYISLTDIARYRNKQEPFAIINNWMRGRSTIEFLGLWEKLSNPDFKPLEFERFRSEAGNNYFVLSPQRWIESTNAIGFISKSRRYGGTYAHKDIAFEFASWISSEFKLYLIKEFQRLKDDENRRLSLAWNLNRTISRLNYRIHTEFIHMGLTQGDRLKRLNEIAIRQMKTLTASNTRALEDGKI